MQDAPRLKGKHSPARRRRNAVIVDLVREAAASFSLTAYSRGKPEASASAAVAEALRLARIEPNGLASIELIWKRRDRPRR